MYLGSQLMGQKELLVTIEVLSGNVERAIKRRGREFAK